MTEVSQVRCKLLCTSLGKRKNWDTAADASKYLYEYEFQAVTGGSEENKKFFASTPSGLLRLSAVRDDLFEPGNEYYLDFTPAN